MTNLNSKHLIDVRHQIFRELVHQGDILVTHVYSEYQHADILTKAVMYDVFVAHQKVFMNLSERVGIYFFAKCLGCGV